MKRNRIELKREKWIVGVCLIGLLMVGACADIDQSKRKKSIEQAAAESESSTAPEAQFLDSAPVGDSLRVNGEVTTTTTRSVTIALSATDNVGVTGYFLSESAATPAASDSGWVSVPSTTSYSASVPFTLSSGNGNKTVYGWFRDISGNLSTPVSGTITLQETVVAVDTTPPASSGDGNITITPTGDSTAPSSPSVSINSGNSSTTTTLVVLTLSARDNVGVTGYYASESSTRPTGDTGWVSVSSANSFTGTVNFTFSTVTTMGSHTKTVYVWFRDASGNVSASASDSITLSVTDTTVPSNPAVTINWNGSLTYYRSVTLNVSATDNVGVTGYYASESATRPPASDNGWVSVSSAGNFYDDVSFSLTRGGGTRTVYVWFKDSAGNISASANDSITFSNGYDSLVWPDTGQTTSYTATFGEDHDYSLRTPSYTDNSNDTITDNVTSLVWQKTDGGQKATRAAAISYCDDLVLAGSSDWRLPHIKELATLIHAGNYNPSINNTYFPTTSSANYWSSTYYSSDYPDWYVSFSYGTVTPSNISNAYARCVRGGAVTSSPHFTDNGNGTVSDSITGLMWQQADGGSKSWTNALTYCESITLAGHSDWRVPNRNDWLSVVDYSYSSPALDSTYFPSTYSERYWSSSPDASGSGYVWYVHFGSGYVIYNSHYSVYVRCVRGGS
ncbi:MAG: DUF1566 domain-containing protein [SAR324 cluster bacterium]|nr:DUF1566 domain-containing protein [SAR324 cluster bacterium]